MLLDTGMVNIGQIIERLVDVQSTMEEKALNKDNSIIMDVFVLDEIINDLKLDIECKIRFD